MYSPIELIKRAFGEQVATLIAQGQLQEVDANLTCDMIKNN